MTAVAYEPAPRGRAGWWRTIGGLLIGELAAAMLISVPLYLLARLGLRDSGAALYRTGTHAGPFPANGPWSIAADAELALVVLAVVTTCVWVALRRISGRDVSLPAIAATIAVTGFAPFFDAHIPRVTADVGFIAAVIAIHYFGVGRRDRRIPWKPAVAVLGIGLLVPASYALAHPFRVSAVGSWSVGTGTEVSQHALISLRNGGVTSVTLSSVDSRVLVGSAFRPVTLRGLAVPARHDVRLYFPAGRCPPETLRVRYRLLSRTFTQPLRLSVCP